jgi:hypothetical protein
MKRWRERVVPGARIGPNVYLFGSIGWRLHDGRGKARSTQVEKVGRNIGQASDVGSIPIARSINDDSIAITSGRR